MEIPAKSVENEWKTGRFSEVNAAVQPRGLPEGHARQRWDGLPHALRGAELRSLAKRASMGDVFAVGSAWWSSEKDPCKRFWVGFGARMVVSMG